MTPNYFSLIQSIMIPPNMLTNDELINDFVTEALKRSTVDQYTRENDPLGTYMYDLRQELLRRLELGEKYEQLN